MGGQKSVSASAGNDTDGDGDGSDLSIDYLSIPLSFPHHSVILNKV